MINQIILEYIQLYKSLVTLTIITAIITFVIESVFIPRILAKAFENINEDSLRYHFIQLIVCWILYKIFSSANDVCNIYIETTLSEFIHNSLYHQLFVKYENTHEKIQSSVVLDKFHLIEEKLNSLLYRFIISLLPRTISLFIIIFNIFTINPKFGLYSSGIMLIAKNLTDDELNYHDSYIEHVDDIFTNMEIIHSTPKAKQKEEDGLNKMSNEYNKLRVTSGMKMTNIQNIIYIGNIILFCILFYYILELYKQKELQANQISVLVLSILPLFNTLSELMYYVPDTYKQWNTLQHNNDFLEELYNYQTHTGKEIQFSSGEIKFDSISFSYQNHSILDNINLTIPSGSFYTLHGESGSGKSTFLKLILGHMKPSSGSIYIDGHSVEELSPISIKQNIIYLNQHATLFNKTVIENILYGHEDTTENRKLIHDIFMKYKVQTIFSDSGSFDFLEKSVGKEGSRLSGGQRQLIQIIRCLLHSSPPIIIMDEPTSAIDMKHTGHVMEMIKDIHKQGKTILLISHSEPETSILKFSNKNVVSIDK